MTQIIFHIVTKYIKIHLLLSCLFKAWHPDLFFKFFHLFRCTETDRIHIYINRTFHSASTTFPHATPILKRITDQCIRWDCSYSIIPIAYLYSGKSHFYYCTVRSVFRHGNPISRTEHIIGRKLDSGYQPHNRIFENQHQDSCRSTQSGKNIHRIFINQGTDYNDHPYTNHNQFYHLIYPFQRMIL